MLHSALCVAFAAANILAPPPPATPLALQICLAPALRDVGSRRQLFANAVALARETRGRGLVLSSGARSIWELRGPLDVANLGTLLGLTPQQAQAALTTAPAAAVARAAKRRAYRGTVTLRVRSPEEAAAAEAAEREAVATAAEVARQQQGKPQRQGGAAAMDVDGPTAAKPQPRTFAQQQQQRPVAGR